MRESLDIPSPPAPLFAPTGSLPQPLDPSSQPLQALLAKARGEALSKQPVAELPVRNLGADGSAPPGTVAFDEKKHVKLAVHAQKPPHKEK